MLILIKIVKIMKYKMRYMEKSNKLLFILKRRRFILKLIKKFLKKLWMNKIKLRKRIYKNKQIQNKNQNKKII